MGKEFVEEKLAEIKEKAAAGGADGVMTYSKEAEEAHYKDMKNKFGKVTNGLEIMMKVNNTEANSKFAKKITMEEKLALLKRHSFEKMFERYVITVQQHVAEKNIDLETLFNQTYDEYQESNPSANVISDE